MFVCGCCGGTYAIAESVRAFHHERGTFWNCPYCLVQWGYPGTGTLAALQRELDAERRRYEETQKRLNAAQTLGKKLARKVKRIEAGVCPECNRHFLNVSRHMSTQHAKALPHVSHALLLPP